MSIKKYLQFVLFATLIIVLVIEISYARNMGGGRTGSFRGGRNTFSGRGTAGSSFRSRSSSGLNPRVGPSGTFKRDFSSPKHQRLGSPKHFRIGSPKHFRIGSPKHDRFALRSGTFNRSFSGRTSFRHGHNFHNRHPSFQCHNRRFGHRGFFFRRFGRHRVFFFSVPLYPYYYPYYGYYPYSYRDDSYTNAYQRDRQEETTEDQTASDETIDDGVIRHLDSISQAFADGKYEQALRYAEQAVIDNSDNALLRFVHSQTLFATGKYTNAASVLRRALQTAVTQKQDVAFAIDLYPDEDILNGQIDALKKAVSSEPQRADLRLLLGYQLFGVGRYEQALESLRQAESDQPNRQAAKVLIDIIERSNQPAPSEAEGPATESEQKPQPAEQDY
jgi:hypothetical protein